MTEQEATGFALAKHPDCRYAKAEYGLGMMFNPTWQVNLWRNEDCYLADDPPRRVVQGIPRDSRLTTAGHADTQKASER